MPFYSSSIAADNKTLKMPRNYGKRPPKCRWREEKGVVLQSSSSSSIQLWFPRFHNSTAAATRPNIYQFGRRPQFWLRISHYVEYLMLSAMAMQPNRSPEMQQILIKKRFFPLPMPGNCCTGGVVCPGLFGTHVRWALQRLKGFFWKVYV